MDSVAAEPPAGPTGPGGAAAVLRRPQVARALGASLLGRLPLGAAPLALLLAARESMSIGLAGVVVGAYLAGTAIGQPAFARLADRTRQPPVLWAAAALSTLGFAAVALRPGVVATIVAALAAGVGTPPFEACLRVLWRELVPDRLLTAAYTLDVTVQEVIFIAGPALTSASVLLFGTTGGLAVTAAVQLAGTALYAGTPAVRAWRGVPAPRHWAGPLRSGRLLWLLAATLLVGAGVGSTTVAVTGYAEAAGDRSWAGWLLAIQAAGALAGGLLSARRAAADPGRTLVRTVAALAALYVPLLLTPAPPMMAVAVAGSGLALPAVLTGVFMVVDRVAPAGTAAEAFAWVATAFAVGSAGGAAVDGTLLDRFTVTAGFLPAPVTIAAAATLLALVRPQRAAPAT